MGVPIYKSRPSFHQTVPDPHLCVTHALWLRHLVSEIRLLESCGTHTLVHGGVGAWWRVWWVQACLDQGFARFTCDHGLEFAGCKSVHMACFTGHQQQDLGSSQSGKFICLTEEERRKFDSQERLYSYEHILFSKAGLGLSSHPRQNDWTVNRIPEVNLWLKKKKYETQK